MFPPFKTEGLPPSGLIAPDQFSSFTYWRAPLPNIPMDELNDVDDKTSEATASKQQQQETLDGKTWKGEKNKGGSE